MNKHYTMQEYIDIFNEYLLTHLPECEFKYDIVHQAMKYSLEIGGKRIRPILVLEFCRLCGGNIYEALPLAAAVEMIHTYSLIHDDLPCMDDDELRRGMPSCHIKFGEEYALLAGDGLLTLAFNIISASGFAAKCPKKAIKAISLLSEYAGVNGMIGGQVIDLKSEGIESCIETLKLMDTLKTGALIKCSALMGVVCADGNTDMLQSAERFAENLGIAFQITDDILDVTGSQEQLGKPIGSDKELSKSTYVSVLGLEKALELAEAYTNKAIEALDIFGEEASFIKDLALKLAHRKN